MPDAASLSGGCLCGAVRFTATADFLAQEACHCSMCRRWVGGPFLGVPCGTSVKVEDERALLAYPSSEWGERVSCARCGSALFWRLRATGACEVAAGAFDDAGSLPLIREIYVDEQPDTYAFANKTERLTGAEVMAAFQANQDS
ncbi:MAG TPA: GFA family protein [Xanthobacteraceae bacterium]|nr:GFA family protein [Xanthobacteraceae bacterium]